MSQPRSRLALAGLVLASEAECVHDPRGFVYPNATYLYANNWLEATYFQTMLTYVRELAGGGLLQLPSSYKDYLNPEIAADLAKPERMLRLLQGDLRGLDMSHLVLRDVYLPVVIAGSVTRCARRICRSAGAVIAAGLSWMLCREARGTRGL